MNKAERMKLLRENMRKLRELRADMEARALQKVKRTDRPELVYKVNRNALVRKK